MSQSKKPVRADKANNWEEGLSPRQEGGTCQRRGDAVWGGTVTAVWEPEQPGKDCPPPAP